MAGYRGNNTNHPRKLRVKKEPFSFKKLDQAQNKRILVLSIAGVSLAIVLIVLAAIDLLPHFDGSLNYLAGKTLLGVDETSIVINASDKTNDPSYYKLGDFKGLDDYTNDPTYSVKNDENETEWCLRPDDKTSKIDFVMVCGCDKTWTEMLETVKTGGMATAEVNISEVIDGVSPVKQNEYHGVITTYLEPDTESNQYFKYYVNYMPTGVDNTCIMVYVNAKAKKAGALPTDEEMRAVVEQAADRIQVR